MRLVQIVHGGGRSGRRFVRSATRSAAVAGLEAVLEVGEERR